MNRRALCESRPALANTPLLVPSGSIPKVDRKKKAGVALVALLARSGCGGVTMSRWQQASSTKRRARPDRSLRARAEPPTLPRWPLQNQMIPEHPIRMVKTLGIHGFSGARVGRIFGTLPTDLVVLLKRGRLTRQKKANEHGKSAPSTYSAPVASALCSLWPHLQPLSLPHPRL